MRWENRVFAVLLNILQLALGIRYWRYTIVTAKVQAYLAQQDSLFYHLRPQFDSLQMAADRPLSENRPAIKRSININTAAKAELTNLPGVGPVLAERIIAYRHKNGLFTSPQELLNIKGIGPKKLDKMKRQLTFK
jgi:comEA protein